MFLVCCVIGSFLLGYVLGVFVMVWSAFEGDFSKLLYAIPKDKKVVLVDREPR